VEISENTKLPIRVVWVGASAAVAIAFAFGIVSFQLDDARARVSRIEADRSVHHDLYMNKIDAVDVHLTKIDDKLDEITRSLQELKRNE
jgi:DnaJ-domain-containing protein 1